MRIARMIVIGNAIVTLVLPLNSLSRPSRGSSAPGFRVAISYVSFLPDGANGDSNMLTAYRLIQFSMMQEMTSLTLRYAFKTPEIAASSAPATTAASRQIYHGRPSPSAQ